MEYINKSLKNSTNFNFERNFAMHVKFKKLCKFWDENSEMIEFLFF